MMKFMKILIVCSIPLWTTSARSATCYFLWQMGWDWGATIGKGLSATMQAFALSNTESAIQVNMEGIEAFGNPPRGGVETLTPMADSGGDLNMAGGAVPTLVTYGIKPASYEGINITTSTSVETLSDKRKQDIITSAGSLDDMSAAQLLENYQAQQRAIRFLAEAIVMKRVLKDMDASISKIYAGADYSNYGNSVTTNASRRLFLDSIMGLQQEVMAVRVRGMAEAVNVEVLSDESAPSSNKTIGSEVYQ